MGESIFFPGIISTDAILRPVVLSGERNWDICIDAILVFTIASAEIFYMLEDESCWLRLLFAFLYRLLSFRDEFWGKGIASLEILQFRNFIGPRIETLGMNFKFLYFVLEIEREILNFMIFWRLKFKG